MNPKLVLSLPLFLAYICSCTVDKNHTSVSNNDSKYLTLSQDLEQKPRAEWPVPIEQLVQNMVALKGGEYKMGCMDEWYDKCDNADRPGHQVRVDGFRIGKYEVTRAQWTSIMDSGEQDDKKNLDEPSAHNTHLKRYPMNNVSWDEVQVFISRLNGLTGKNFRLPKEAEWEYAARAGERYRFAGHEYIDSVAWYKENSGNVIHSIGQKAPNAFGLYDMSGNVAEWCYDFFSFGYYEVSPKDNPKGPGSGSYRSVRGGSYDYAANYSMVTYRGATKQSSGTENIGFRLVEPDKPESASWPGPIRNLVEDMIRIQGGTFQMGCTSEQLDECESWEYPVHKVEIEGFQIGKYEVSQAQWSAIMGNNPSKFAGCERCPVDSVSWMDVQLFIQRLNDLTQMSFRLPTEAEWEYAARGRRTTKYAGSHHIDSVGWFAANSEGKTHPVGLKKPNGYNLCDMSGNVSEWCQEVYYSYDHQDVKEIENGKTSSHIVRGGSWFVPARSNRISARGSLKANKKYPIVGFRLAL